MKKVLVCGLVLVSAVLLNAQGVKETITEFERGDIPVVMEESTQEITVLGCRTNATVWMDGIKVRMDHEKTEDTEVITGAINYSENENEKKTTPGPVTGFEGHNFIESPAIIYPNPVQNIMQVKSTDPITVIEILNLHGQIMKSFVIGEELSVQDLAAGNYYVRIHFENIPDVQMEKIIITN